jgi:hypothetical protein
VRALGSSTLGKGLAADRTVVRILGSLTLGKALLTIITEMILGGVNALGGNVGADVTEVISVGIYAYAVLRTAEITKVILVMVFVNACSRGGVFCFKLRLTDITDKVCVSVDVLAFRVFLRSDGKQIAGCERKHGQKKKCH